MGAWGKGEKEGGEMERKTIAERTRIRGEEFRKAYEIFISAFLDICRTILGMI